MLAWFQAPAEDLSVFGHGQPCRVRRPDFLNYLDILIGMEAFYIVFLGGLAIIVVTAWLFVIRHKRRQRRGFSTGYSPDGSGGWFFSSGVDPTNSTADGSGGSYFDSGGGSGSPGGSYCGGGGDHGHADSTGYDGGGGFGGGGGFDGGGGDGGD